MGEYSLEGVIRYHKKCGLCGLKIPLSESCTYRKLKCNGIILKRVPFGDEEYNWSTRRCQDCGVYRGGYHHENCACEICPMCGELLTQCDCDAQFVI